MKTTKDIMNMIMDDILSIPPAKILFDKTTQNVLNGMMYYYLNF